MTEFGQTRQADHGKNRDIEVLRAFAILGVLVHHLDGALLTPAPGLPLSSLGLGSGVDLFFAISGFVIARSLLPRLRAGRASGRPGAEVLAFWVKRIFRLWPTAWFWLAAILATTALFQFQNPFLSFPINVDATVAGVLNFANFRFAGTFAQSTYGASFHFWTLSLEEQFYFLLPLLALLSGKRLVLILPILIAIDLLRPASILSIFTRSSTLLLGVLIAMFSQTEVHRQLSERFGKLGRWIMFGLMIGSVALVPWAETATLNLAPFHYGYVAMAAGLCTLLASFDRDGLCPGGVWTAVTQWMGARSYAIYVIHVPAFLVIGEIARARMGNQLGQIWPAAAVMAAGCGVVFLLAELNFRLIETPLRKIGVKLAARISRPQVAGPAAKPVETIHR